MYVASFGCHFSCQLHKWYELKNGNSVIFAFRQLLPFGNRGSRMAPQTGRRRPPTPRADDILKFAGHPCTIAFIVVSLWRRLCIAGDFFGLR